MSNDEKINDSRKEEILAKSRESGNDEGMDYYSDSKLTLQFEYSL